MPKFLAYLDFQDGKEFDEKNRADARKTAVKEFEALVNTEDFIIKHITLYERRRCKICKKNFFFDTDVEENVSKVKQTTCRNCLLRQFNGYKFDEDSEE